MIKDYADSFKFHSNTQGYQLVLSDPKYVFDNQSIYGAKAQWSFEVINGSFSYKNGT
jgi:hypothetical protein